jgi:transcriptional regulator with XRE-family HTH domain
MTPPVKIDQKLARALRSLREQRGITQEDLAHAADVTTTALSRIEGGKANPTWTTLARILDALNASLTELEAVLARAKTLSLRKRS